MKPQRDDIPQELALFLREMGLVEQREEHVVKDYQNHTAWAPTYEGEEPPF
jgi:hypothetical protein